MNEQTLKEAKRIYDEEKEYLRDWDEAIKDNYRMIKDKHDERRLMRELEGGL